MEAKELIERYSAGEINFSEADLREANLSWANLSGTNLRGSSLSGSSLHGANLSEADLSGATGLLNPSGWIAGFASDEFGVLVYKKIGDTDYGSFLPSHWAIKPGSVLTEVCNPDRCTECGCGVNFGTKEWCEDSYLEADLWLCRIAWADLPGVVVPYNTDGKARCERLTLLEQVQ